MPLSEKLIHFVFSEEGAIAKSATLGIGAVLSIVALAAMPGPAEAANCPGSCSYCGSWHNLYMCSPPWQSCQLQYRECASGCMEYRLVGNCPPDADEVCFCN